jgi:hypothetical protein
MDDVQAILGRCRETYATCASYRDTGLVRTVMTAPIEHTSVIHFRTAFVRPDRFRFEFEQHD